MPRWPAQGTHGRAGPPPRPGRLLSWAPGDLWAAFSSLTVSQGRHKAAPGRRFPRGRSQSWPGEKHEARRAGPESGSGPRVSVSAHGTGSGCHLWSRSQPCPPRPRPQAGLWLLWLLASVSPSRSSLPLTHGSVSCPGGTREASRDLRGPRLPPGEASSPRRRPPLCPCLLLTPDLPQGLAAAGPGACGGACGERTRAEMRGLETAKGSRSATVVGPHGGRRFLDSAGRSRQSPGPQRSGRCTVRLTLTQRHVSTLREDGRTDGRTPRGKGGRPRGLPEDVAGTCLPPSPGASCCSALGASALGGGDFAES